MLQYLSVTVEDHALILISSHMFSDAIPFNEVFFC
jgi:hypothetical protein